MGMMPAPETCYITDLKTLPVASDLDMIEYFIPMYGSQAILRFNPRYTISDNVQNNKHILKGLILNRQFPIEYFKGEELTNEILEGIINKSDIPRSPEQKANRLLMFLHSKSGYDGAIINFEDEEIRNLATKLYFKNDKELNFYVFTLKSEGLLEGIEIASKTGLRLNNINLTFNGLSKVIELSQSGEDSDRCFIAMSFSKEMTETRNAIKEAVSNSGYQPILIDEQHIDSDVTINDALIAEIRGCKFLIADFTEHKHGVYFESGFALGLNRKVIYTCHKKDFKDSHFDTSHYAHIVYSSNDELKAQLQAKIKAWVI